MTRYRKLKATDTRAPRRDRYPGLMGLGAAFLAATMVVSLFGYSAAETVDNGTVMLTSNGYEDTGHFDRVWDLTDGEITISFTYNANGMVDDYYDAVKEYLAHAWAELGVRTYSFEDDFNPYGESTIYEPVTYKLLAAQHVFIGEVTVQRVDDTLFVTFTILEEGWLIIETHVDVRENQYQVPQTASGNPIPGKFTHRMYHDPPVTEYTFAVDISDYSHCDKLYVAAHAHVEHFTEYNQVIVSDESVLWSGDGLSWSNAVACYVHPSWPTSISDATWIWRTYSTDVVWEYYNVPDGGWWFAKTLDIPAEAFDISGTVMADADNGEALYIGDALVFQDGSMDKDGPDNAEWATIETGDISDLLVPGQNTLTFRALNFFSTGTSESNPAGLVFRADVSYKVIDKVESAWAGDEPFFGANWAKFLIYEPTSSSTVEGSGVWLATDYLWEVNTFDPDPVGYPNLDMDDKLLLQRQGGMDEGAYDLPDKPPSPGNNHRFWFDRDGVDQWQDDSPLAENGGTYNTGGIYHIEITLLATSETTATAFMTINGLDQGFETDGIWSTMELPQAGMTWSGDMHHLAVFYGLYGFGAEHSATFSDITITQ